MRIFIFLIFMLFSTCAFCNSGWTHYPQDAASLLNIRSIVFDDQGTVYIGTMHGIDVLKDGVWSRFDNENTDISGTSAWTIRNLVFDKDGNLWASTPEGLLKYDGGWHRLDEENCEMKGSNTYTVTFDSEGDMWFGTDYVFLQKYDGHEFAYYSQLDMGQSYYPNPNGYRYVLDDEGNIWYNGFYTVVKYDGESWIRFDNTNSTLQASPTFVRDIFRLSDNSIWAYQANNLVYYKDGEWKKLEKAGTPMEGSGDIKRVFEDNLGNRYFTDDLAKIFVQYKEGGWGEIPFPEHSSSVIIMSAAVDKQNRIWVGTVQTGLYVYDGVAGVEDKAQKAFVLTCYGDELRIESQGGAGDISMAISIVDVTGAEIRNAGPLIAGERKILDISGLNSGMYFVLVSGGGKHETYRLPVMR